MKKFGNRCAVSDYSVQEILIASHIVPWGDSSDEERLDSDNGIFLSPAYDALFDQHLISFSDEGCVIISDKLSQDDLESLSIR